MIQYVILPRVVTEVMADAWMKSTVQPTRMKSAQADLDAFVSAAPDHGMVAVSREDLQRVLRKLELIKENPCNVIGHKVIFSVRESANHLSAALEGK